MNNLKTVHSLIVALDGRHSPCLGSELVKLLEVLSLLFGDPSMCLALAMT